MMILNATSRIFEASNNCQSHWFQDAWKGCRNGCRTIRRSAGARRQRRSLCGCQVWFHLNKRRRLDGALNLEPGEDVIKLSALCAGLRLVHSSWWCHQGQVPMGGRPGATTAPSFSTTPQFWTASTPLLKLGYDTVYEIGRGLWNSPEEKGGLLQPRVQWKDRGNWVYP